jgi:hypothetical protein
MATRTNLRRAQGLQEDAPGRKILRKRSYLNITVRRKLRGEQSQENIPLRKLPAEDSYVNMAVRRILPENHGS